MRNNNNKKGIVAKIRDSVKDIIMLERKETGYDFNKNVYERTWAGGKIVDIPVDDMFIVERNIEDENISKILRSTYDELSINNKIKYAVKLSRIYGTAFMFLITDDINYSAPLSNTSKLKNIIVFDNNPSNITIDSTDSICTDFNSIIFNTPKYYKLNFTNSNVVSKVHYSRLIRIDNTPVSMTNKSYQDNWGKSIYDKVWANVKSEVDAFACIDQLMNESSIPILKIPELAGAMDGSRDSIYENKNDTKDRFQKLLGIFNRNKSVYNTIALDDNSSLERLEASFSNFDKVIDRINQRLSACEDIPQSRFFGDTPSGLNSNGDADMKNYSIKIMSMQKEILRPIYNILDKLILSQDEPVGYSFDSILDTGDEVKSNINLNNANTIDKLLNRNVIDEEEARKLLTNDTQKLLS